jgi:hypothetical protein
LLVIVLPPKFNHFVEFHAPPSRLECVPRKIQGLEHRQISACLGLTKGGGTLVYLSDQTTMHAHRTHDFLTWSLDASWDAPRISVWHDSPAMNYSLPGLPVALNFPPGFKLLPFGFPDLADAACVTSRSKSTRDDLSAVMLPSSPRWKHGQPPSLFWFLSFFAVDESL